MSAKYSLPFKAFFLAGAFIFGGGYIAYFSCKAHKETNNRSQKKLVGYLNDFYQNTDPQISIFDPACIVYKRKTNCKYILYNSAFYDNFHSYLRKHNFDIILATEMVNFFALMRYERLNFRYIKIKNHIYYKALALSIKDQNQEDQNRERRRPPPRFNKGPVKDQNHKSSAIPSPPLSNGFPTEDQKTIVSYKGILSKAGQGGNSANPNQKIPRPLSQESLINRSGLKFSGFIEGEIRKNSNQINLISGKQLMETLARSLPISLPESAEQYSYFFIDDQNRAVKKAVCSKQEIALPLLKPGCSYTKEEFIKGFISIKDKDLALFYLPLPFDTLENGSGQVLFRYNLY